MCPCSPATTGVLQASGQGDHQEPGQDAGPGPEAELCAAHAVGRWSEKRAIDTRGKIISSCVVEYIEMAPGASKNAPSGKYEILVMRIVHNLFADSARRPQPRTWRKSGGVVAVADVVGRDEAMEFFTAEPEVAGKSEETIKRTFRRALEECARKGLLLAHKNEIALPNDGGMGRF